MGGPGSGRQWHYGARNTTDSYPSIDVRRWQREGYLEPYRSFTWRWIRNDEAVFSIQVETEPA